MYSCSTYVTYSISYAIYLFFRMNMLQYILKDVQPENITSVQQVETKLKELQQFSNELCESLSKEWSVYI